MKKIKKPFGWKSQKVLCIHVKQGYYTKEELRALLDLLDGATILGDTEIPISL
jgi:hypothetical protein